MSSLVRCGSCGHLFKTPSEPGSGSDACPYCGKRLDTTDEPAAAVTPASEQLSNTASPPKNLTWQRMFHALLDPTSIQWILMIGGALCVLGLVIWLVSLGVFKDPHVLAITLGVGTLAILGTGWFFALRTRFRTAGQAITFLGCVVAPLNLWFYHAQHLITVDGHLWVGGVVCCLLYAATVVALRDATFMYAIEAGVTLTTLLLLGDMGKITDAAWLSLFFTALGLISIHVERMFSPAEDAQFPRRRFGMPLFWSGHAQIAASLSILLCSQLLGWLIGPVHQLTGFEWAGNLLTNNYLLAAGIWLAGVYAYLYSDLVVRRVGIYLILAGVCMVMTEITLMLGFDIRAEWILAAMAVTSVTINAFARRWPGNYPNVERFVPSLGLVLGFVPTMWGVALHLRTTSSAANQFGWPYETGAAFVAVMAITAVANQLNAYLCRREHAKSSTVYVFLSATSLLIAAVGLLGVLHVNLWCDQAPWMMLIPMGYLVASQVWRNHSIAKPFYWVAHVATVVILLHVFGAALDNLRAFAAMTGQHSSLMLGLVFAEAAGFYFLAGMFRPGTANVYFAAAAACGAMWQFLGFYGIDERYYTMLYAALGVSCIVSSRVMGLKHASTGSDLNAETSPSRERGLPLFQCGNGILGVACLAALMQGLAGLAVRNGAWFDIVPLAVTAVTAGLAALVVPAANWRRLYASAGVAIGAVVLLRVNLLIHLSGWQKFEMFCVVVGFIMLVASHIGLFGEDEGERKENVGLGLAVGSVLVPLPLLIASLYHRWVIGQPSTFDELALLTLTVPMLVTGLSWKIRSTTLWGGGTLSLYLIVLILALVHHPQVAVGIYLAVGGAVVFGVGIILSIYRDKLMQIPDQVANRTGVFKILNWR